MKWDRSVAVPLSWLSALAERAPRSTHIWREEELVSIPAEQVEVGMEIVVKPGELIPVDGVVTAGSSSLSEADLMGEPVTVRKAPGMLVLSGSVNQEGFDVIMILNALRAGRATF
jgi:P-type E1-E2 ATPase